MRENKFRAWHEEEKVMLFDNIPGDCLRWKNEGQPLIVMQYTGLKDKNGVEIYEGDVIEFKDFSSYGYIFNKQLSRSVVKWNLKKARLEAGDVSLYIIAKKVIGNIFDNPDLVGDTNGN